MTDDSNPDYALYLNPDKETQESTRYNQDVFAHYALDTFLLMTENEGKQNASKWLAEMLASPYSVRLPKYRMALTNSMLCVARTKNKAQSGNAT